MQQKLVAEQDRQLVSSDQAALVYSQQNFQRYSALARSGAGSVQQAQQATADIREKEAGSQHDSTAVAVANTTDARWIDGLRDLVWLFRI